MYSVYKQDIMDKRLAKERKEIELEKENQKKNIGKNNFVWHGVEQFGAKKYTGFAYSAAPRNDKELTRSLSSKLRVGILKRFSQLATIKPVSA